MGELEEQLNSILGDPQQMEKIAGLARSLMGGGQEPPAPEAAAPDAAMMQRLARLMQSGGDRREQTLLKAMAPYLTEKRRGRLDRALGLARLARIARLAMDETGGRDDEAL